MVRSKVKYELIEDERTRQETFKKRKSGLFKKLEELKTLSNADVCGVVIAGDATEVWPSAQAANQVIQRFKNLPSSSQANHMVDQAGFIRLNLSRISRNMDKESMKVESLEKELFLAQSLAKQEVDATDPNELEEILCMLDRKIEVVDQMIMEIEPPNLKKAERNIRASYHGKGKQPL